MKPRFHKSRLASFTLALTAGVLATASTAQAQTYYWDNNGTDAGFGTAGGTWTIPTVSQWSTDATGVLEPGASITTLTTDALNFGTATDGLGAGTITLSGTVDANTLTFGSASGAILLSGGILNLGGTTPTITVNNAANTIDSVIAGSGLTMSGIGVLTLSGANTFSGTTVISDGKISFTNSSAFGTTSVISVRNTSSLEFGANGLDLDRNVQMQNSSGSKTLQLDLAGTNTGTLSGDLDIRYSTAGDFFINIGTDDTLTLSGTVNTGAGGGAGLTKTGAGTLDIAGATANTYVGTTTVSEGTIVLSKALAIQNSALNTTGAGFVTLNGVTAPTFGGLSNSGTTRDLATVISSGYGSVTNLTLKPGSGTVTYNGVIADGATGMTLTKTGAGTQVLAGINTYTGATTISGGILALSGGAAIADAGSVDVQDVAGATLRLDSSETIGKLTGGGATGGTVNLQANTLTVGDATNQTFAGKISGSAGCGLTKVGVGTLTLTSSNTYSGDTTINSGTLRLEATGPSNYNTNKTYNINNGSTLVLATGAGTNPTIQGTVVNIDSNGGATITLDGINGLIQGTGGSTFTINSTGGAQNQVTSTGGSGFNAQTVDRPVIFNVASGSNATADFLVTGGMGRSGIEKNGSGKLLFTTSNVGTLGTGIETITINGGIMEIGGSITLTQKSGMAFTNDGTFSWDSTANQTLANTISGNGTLTKSNTSTLTLTGANTYTGATTVSDGTLAITAGSSDSPITVNSGAVLELTVDSTITSTSSLTLDGGSTVSVTGSPTLGSYTLLTAAGGITGTPVLAAPVTGYELVVDGTSLKLNATAGSPYTAWASTNAPTGNPDDDFDGDGVSNAAEFVLGGLASTNDLAKLPVLSTSGANMLFSFKRDQDSIHATTSVKIEVGTTLAAWPVSYTVGADTAGSDAGVTIVKDSPVSGTDTVTLSVAISPDAKKFARLKVVQD